MHKGLDAMSACRNMSRNCSAMVQKDTAYFDAGEVLESFCLIYLLDLFLPVPPAQPSIPTSFLCSLRCGGLPFP